MFGQEVVKLKVKLDKLVAQVREQREWERLEKVAGGSENGDEKDGKDLCDIMSPQTFKTTTSSSLLWIYLYRCSKQGSRSLWKGKKNVAMEEQVRSLTDKIIQYRLSKSRPDDNVLSYRVNKPVRQDLVQCLCNMTDIMIEVNPGLYNDIALKLNITFQEERLVCKAFSDFAEVLFSKGPTWPLLVSLYTFASCLAVECSKNGRSILVKSISDWTAIFIVMRLREWIVDNGKWNGVLQFFEPKKQSSDAFLDELYSKLLSYGTPVRHTVVGSSLVVGLYVLYSTGCTVFEFLGGK